VLKKWMDEFEATGKLTVSAEQLKQAQAEFASARVAKEENLANIKAQYEKVCAVHS
jgi:hypothetical protein